MDNTRRVRRLRGPAGEGGDGPEVAPADNRCFRHSLTGHKEMFVLRHVTTL